MGRFCLVLNCAYQPVNGVTEEEAVIMIVQGKAQIKEADPTRFYRSKYLSINAPKVIVLNHYVEPVSFKFQPERLDNNNLFKRDKHRCQYCGKLRDRLRGDKLTMDHIIPRSKGGKHEWTNVVTACSSCNHRKADRTPQEAGMGLMAVPKIPLTWTIRGKSNLSPEQIAIAEEVLNIKKKGKN